MIGCTLGFFSSFFPDVAAFSSFFFCFFSSFFALSSLLVGIVVQSDRSPSDRISSSSARGVARISSAGDAAASIISSGISVSSIFSGDLVRCFLDGEPPRPNSKYSFAVLDSAVNLLDLKLSLSPSRGLITAVDGRHLFLGVFTGVTCTGVPGMLAYLLLLPVGGDASPFAAPA